MSLAPDERKLTARGQERRDELVRVAISKFAEQGYHPTSVAEIVEGVGVGKGVFYWYFTSKEDLLREILADALLDVRRHQMAAIRAEDNPVRRLELGVRVSLQWMADNIDLMRLVDFAWTEDTFAAELRRGREISIEDTMRHLSDAMDQGMVRLGDARTMAISIRGMTEELNRMAADSGQPVDPDAAVAMVLRGING